MPTNGFSAFSYNACPNTMNRISLHTASRCSTNNSCQRNRRSKSSKPAFEESTTMPSSSNVVSASPCRERCEPPCAVSDAKWRAFIAALLAGNAVHTRALNRSCQFASRTRTSPFRYVLGSNASSNRAGLPCWATKRTGVPDALTGHLAHCRPRALRSLTSGHASFDRNRATGRKGANRSDTAGHSGFHCPEDGVTSASSVKIGGSKITCETSHSEILS